MRQKRGKQPPLKLKSVIPVSAWAHFLAHFSAEAPSGPDRVGQPGASRRAGPAGPAVGYWFQCIAKKKKSKTHENTY